MFPAAFSRPGSWDLKYPSLFYNIAILAVKQYITQNLASGAFNKIWVLKAKIKYTIIAFFCYVSMSVSMGSHGTKYENRHNKEEVLSLGNESCSLTYSEITHLVSLL